MTRKVGVTVRMALGAAVKMRLVPANVGLVAPLPEVPRYRPRVFTRDEVGGQPGPCSAPTPSRAVSTAGGATGPGS